MESNEYNWHEGEIAILPWTSTTFKKSGSTIYKHYFRSRFVCIRESNEEQSGILVKVLSDTAKHRISMVGSEPFCKDDVDDLSAGIALSSFRFPMLEELTEVLDIIRGNQNLMPVFKDASMNLDLNGTFWIRETARKLLLQKKPMFYDANSDSLMTAADDTPHSRISLVYFQNGNLTW